MVYFIDYKHSIVLFYLMGLLLRLVIFNEMFYKQKMLNLHRNCFINRFLLQT
jgi:hypothetical protein